MAISKKRKRQIVYNGQSYLWFVKEDDDSFDTYLYIISTDKKLQLTYRTNQINDCFIAPKIFVKQSEKLKYGLYQFFPPISDEFISAHNVRAILNWHNEQNSDIEPIVFKYDSNPFNGIDFKSGIVMHIENDFSNETLREDMLQVTFPENYILDVGWYGTMKGFIIFIIKNNDWENPIKKCSKGFYGLNEAVINAIATIETLIVGENPNRKAVQKNSHR